MVEVASEQWSLATSHSTLLSVFVKKVSKCRCFCCEWNMDWAAKKYKSGKNYWSISSSDFHNASFSILKLAELIWKYGVRKVFSTVNRAIK